MVEAPIVPFPTLESVQGEIARFGRENNLKPAELMEIFIVGSIAIQRERGVCLHPVVVYFGRESAAAGGAA